MSHNYLNFSQFKPCHVEKKKRHFQIMFISTTSLYSTPYVCSLEVDDLSSSTEAFFNIIPLAISKTNIVRNINFPSLFSQHFFLYSFLATCLLSTANATGKDCCFSVPIPLFTFFALLCRFLSSLHITLRRAHTHTGVGK